MTLFQWVIAVLFLILVVQVRLVRLVLSDIANSLRSHSPGIQQRLKIIADAISEQTHLIAIKLPGETYENEEEDWDEKSDDEEERP
jgi:hypothetical protein